MTLVIVGLEIHNFNLCFAPWPRIHPAVDLASDILGGFFFFGRVELEGG